MRYGWNYAQLLAHGPSENALVPSPLVQAMKLGKIARVEELTRIPADVQDTLITVLSEKTLPIPELGSEVQATRGFSVIATANNRDKGVNELSSALKRRFNTVVLPVPSSEQEEVQIVAKRVAELGRALELPAEPPGLSEIRRVVQIFRELRNGQTEDGKTRIKSPSSTLSTAEAIRDQQRHGPGRAFWGRLPACRRHCIGPHRCHRERPRARPGGVEGISGDRGQGTPRLDGTLPRLP